jgi:hypothetical protein
MTNHTTAIYDALVDLAHSLRPSWDPAGIRQAIRTALVRQPMPNLADLAYALVRLAIDPTIGAPSVLGMDGPHWHTTTVQHGTPVPDGRCVICHTFHSTLECPGRPVRIGDHRAGIVDVRAAYAQATANLCPHGVGWRDCHQHNGHVIAGEVVKETE